MDNFTALTLRFGITSPVRAMKRISSGQINDTFEIECECGGRYILQRINTEVFQKPREIMRNVSMLEKVFEDESSPNISRYLKCGENNYLEKDGSIWRICRFFEDTISLESFDDDPLRLCRGFGKILGGFHCSAKKADEKGFCETIPDFHNTPKIIDRLFSLDIDTAYEDILRRAAEYSKELFTKEKKQIVHNDAKCSNILFYKDHSPAAVIDLDTVMSGLPVYDIGDAVRSSCAVGNRIVPERFQSLISGYVEENGDVNIESCVYAAVCTSAELAARYLFDAVSDENYFRFKTSQAKLRRFEELAALSENIETKAEELIKSI